MIDETKLQELLGQIQELVNEVQGMLGSQEQPEEEEKMPMDEDEEAVQMETRNKKKEAFLSKPPIVREAIEKKQVMARKPKEENEED